MKIPLPQLRKSLLLNSVNIKKKLIYLPNLILRFNILYHVDPCRLVSTLLLKVSSYFFLVAPINTTPLQNHLGHTTKFTCAGKASGFYPDPNACDSYYICAGNMAFDVHCASGLLYNTVSKFCDWARNVHCTVNHQASGASTVRPGGSQTSKTTQAPIKTKTTTQKTNAPTTPSTKAPTTTHAPTQRPVTAKPSTKAVYTHTPTRYPFWTIAPTSAPKITTATAYPFWTIAPTSAPKVTTATTYSGMIHVLSATSIEPQYLIVCM